MTDGRKGAAIIAKLGIILIALFLGNFLLFSKYAMISHSSINTVLLKEKHAHIWYQTYPNCITGRMIFEVAHSANVLL